MELTPQNVTAVTDECLAGAGTVSGVVEVEGDHQELLLPRGQSLRAQRRHCEHARPVARRVR